MVNATTQEKTMSRYILVSNENQPRMIDGPTIQDVAGDFQYFVYYPDSARQLGPQPWVLFWEPFGKEADDKLALRSHQSQEQKEKMVEIAFTLAYSCRSTGFDASVFYSLDNIERDELGFITNASINRVSTA